MRLVLVGCGNMGFAMLQGWLSEGVLRPSDVSVVEPNATLRARANDLRAHAVTSANDLPVDLQPDIILLAVKPQVMADVAPAYARFSNPAFVSVAAGVSTDKLSQYLGTEAAIARVMPNTPSAVRQGMLITYFNHAVTNEQKASVEKLMAVIGETATIEDEDLMDAVTGVSGSGPAYLFHMIEAMTAAGVQAGLTEELSAKLAMQTIYGAAVYAKESAETPEVLRKQVTSPNGTTQAGLEVLMAEGDGLTELMTKTVAAAAERSRKLR
ncbi:MAG: pyrroline-5-carboxylate reductase [Pseudomonadota bacterium]